MIYERMFTYLAHSDNIILKQQKITNVMICKL